MFLKLFPTIDVCYYATLCNTTFSGYTGALKLHEKSQQVEAGVVVQGLRNLPCAH